MPQIYKIVDSVIFVNLQGESLVLKPGPPVTVYTATEVATFLLSKLKHVGPQNSGRMEAILTQRYGPPAPGLDVPEGIIIEDLQGFLVDAQAKGIIEVYTPPPPPVPWLSEKIPGEPPIPAYEKPALRTDVQLAGTYSLWPKAWPR